ncbi:isoleucine--tRNA ligase [Kineosporia sp. NBRC 101731]|uniref:isoleucine--tRNA ligase n=1 Tax=Kineosporia sp. NBRC 101731 TaxID=3032199 RepID=UPI0024A47D4A|nr:isoleucine--tRNA ligase [Kineosporia sp. NBRC 101731]GLY28867.1 isoleucine--tRNA ligase [Kineosporia sp. NBRC 101731]
MTRPPAPRSPFEALPSRIDLPATDHRITAWWKSHDVFARSLARTADGPAWAFYEGPPTANGAPGTHHVEARVFKDVFPRFKTMKGFSVPRQAGWDCHGLPVELAVEKELGLTDRPGIEKAGVAFFNERCRESVTRHVGEFEKLTDRMGYWIDLENAYETMSPEYIDSVWWSLAKIHADGRLTEDFRVTPYCPRDQTTLSDHEVAQGYETVTDPSVFVRFPLQAPLRGQPDVDLLVWTTTPWTLVANTAVAVNPEITYVVTHTARGTFVVAEPLLDVLRDEEPEVLARVPGVDLAGLRYHRPFDLVDIPDAHLVVLADYVTTADGTGLVHQAPAFGADDLSVSRAHRLPVVNPVGRDGRFHDELPLVGGTFFKDADPIVIDDLRSRGLLLRVQPVEHPYPHCWRCHTPLMYYAQPSWYIRTTRVRQALLRENESTTWFPSHIKHGRYGDWLENNIDWALSRSRYWGTPLPLWRCRNSHVTAISSRADLGRRTGQDLSQLDPHRPFIDEITFACPDCGETSTRVPEVIDAWYDSGAMPFAAHGYPHVPGSVEAFEATYPAQYIAEAIDQTRGWFYTLMAVGTLVFDRSPYENVVCLGHIMAEDGRKMSKHLGNILAPIPLMDDHGADALRWFMACSGSPWSQRRVGSAPLEEIVRKVLMTDWNTASFFTLHASRAGWEPPSAAPAGTRPLLDRWILGEVHLLTDAVDDRLENFDTAGAGRLLAEFVDELSNWYVRRNRKRFGLGDQDALATLFECLEILTRLLAPIVPFVTEEIWQRVVRPGQPDAADSVHLATWPVPDLTRVEPDLQAQVRISRALAEAGRAARKSARVRVRQPLARALVGLPAGVEMAAALLDDIADELNVKELVRLDAADAVVDIAVKPSFRNLGKRFGPRTPQIARAIRAQDPVVLVGRLRSGDSAAVDVDGETVTVGPDDVQITEIPRTGWVVESQREVTLALDARVTPSLAAEGTARDLVRVVQQARRASGFDPSDAVRVSVDGPDEVLDAVREHADFVRRETLAVRLDLGGPAAGQFTGNVGEGHTVRVDVVRP